ncbi:hypothetical protein QIS99_28785 [Streptomyces sp. B-S-A8]|uniref:CHAD domain-containing protein n=1 Tax=Streptomyces solicavernae TaxID=3043614 RepID=A0ABT6S0H3_9ACTN|nr:hypothetical protein [Streptomyces sp. B-S-A8]MDI3390157.1 hypothetical protein [Streptomyces sp. B-S-A8]
MAARPLIRHIQLELADTAARLARVDATPEPAEPRPRWHYLCRRRTLLDGLVDDAERLALAHARSGDLGAAAAVHELVEHYQHLHHLARRAIELHQPVLARSMHRFAPRQP